MAEITKQFETLQRSYGLTTPAQIKERILWKHLKLLIRKAYDGPETVKSLAYYDKQWEVLEEIENLNQQ